MDLKLKNKILFIIYCTCIILSTTFFIKQFTKYKLDIKINIIYLIYFIFLYLISHLFRLLRLFTIYVEEKISFKKLLEAYIVMNYVNFFIPYKIGDFFRILEMSYLTGNLKKGLTGIWIDRFFDTIILFIFLAVYNSSYKGITKILLFCFGVFILFSLFCYLFSTYTNTYINNIMLTKSTTKKGLYILKIVDYMETVKETAEYLLKGKIFILFLMSLFVWIIEIYSLKLLSKVFESNLDIKNSLNMIILNWLKNIKILNLDKYVLLCFTFLFSIIFIFEYSKERTLEYMKGEK